MVHDCDVPPPSVAADAKVANLSTEGGITSYYTVHFISATTLPYPSRETPATSNPTKKISKTEILTLVLSLKTFVIKKMLYTLDILNSFRWVDVFI